MAKGRIHAGLVTLATFSLSFFALSNINQCAALPTQPSKRLAREPWKPSAGLTWDYQLTGKIAVDSVNVDVWDIDLFDATSTTINAIHAQGKHVICYFSAGSFEDWREDAERFQSSDTGSGLKGWEGENWLDTRSSNVRDIMLSRLAMAAQKNCDGVEPDNVDAYDNGNGLRLTADDAVDYVTFLAGAAHSKNMAIGLKNAGKIVPRLVDTVDFSVQEECVQYGNCDEFQPFIDAGKPVFHVEYSNGGSSSDDSYGDDSSRNEEEGDTEDYHDDEGGVDEDGYDEDGYDKNGYDKDGYDKDGYDEDGLDGDGYDGEDVDSDNKVKRNTDQSTSGASTKKKSTARVSSNGKFASTTSPSSGCGGDLPGFSSIVKNLDLDAWIQICSWL